MREGKEQLEKTAEVLRLHLTEGLGICSIAPKLSMSRKTVRRVLGKAAKKLVFQCLNSRASGLSTRRRAVTHGQQES